jgi:UDP-N-acetylmuramate: L-alanyl-gamma-D-glutamyl-meso-diaminopimelate ligase
MHIHILGIGGTFMSALAILAKAKGYRVTGNDAQCYPPISDVLNQHHIEYIEGYEDTSLMLQADEVVVGNAMKRGLPVVEALLNAHKRYTSGPEWLAREILKDKKVLAIAGTHGKTSTSTMIAYILTQAGMRPSYLLGGVPQALPTNAKLDDGEWFVIEADEYDTAFFDKRPKFLHYRPEGLVMHNLEFDHADIYTSLEAIQLQFHYLLRSVPKKGWVIRPAQDNGLDGAERLGIFTPTLRWGYESTADVQIQNCAADGSAFSIAGVDVKWSLLGRHNVENAVAAMLACEHLGVSLSISGAILSTYQPVKRRMEICMQHSNFMVYDDFAHHPTAIQKTTQAIKASGKHQRLLAILEFGSNSMRGGHHLEGMPQALSYVDDLYVVRSEQFNVEEHAKRWPCRVHICASVDDLVQRISSNIQAQDAIVMMSNKGFDQLKPKLLKQLEAMD